MNQARLTIGLVTMAFSLTLAGCGGSKNFSGEDFKKVQPGMSEDQVTEILGKPFDAAEAIGIKRLWWKVGDSYYSASFKGGKVEEAEGPGKKDDYQLLKGMMQGLQNRGQPGAQPPTAPRRRRLTRSRTSPTQPKTAQLRSSRNWEVRQTGRTGQTCLECRSHVQPCDRCRSAGVERVQTA